MYRKSHTAPFTSIFQPVNSSEHHSQPYQSQRQTSPPHLSPADFTSHSKILLYIPLKKFGDYIHPSVDGDITLKILVTDKLFGMVNRPRKIFMEAIPL
jgi:hypothetical protein